MPSSLKRVAITVIATLGLLGGVGTVTAVAAPAAPMTFGGYGPTPLSAHNSALALAEADGYIPQQCTDFYNDNILYGYWTDDLYCV